MINGREKAELAGGCKSEILFLPLGGFDVDIKAFLPVCV